MKYEIGQKDRNNQYFYFQLISISIFVIVKFLVLFLAIIPWEIKLNVDI